MLFRIVCDIASRQACFHKKNQNQNQVKSSPAGLDAFFVRKNQLARFLKDKINITQTLMIR